MTTLQSTDSSILSLLVLLLLFFRSYRKSERAHLPNRLFLALILSNMALLVIDLLGWAFNGLPGLFYFQLNRAFNLLLYVAEPLAPSLWILYTTLQVLRDESRLRKTALLLLLFLLLNAVLALCSLKTGWFFFVDPANLYHRGEYFFFHVAYCYALFLYSFFFVLTQRALVEKRYYYSLLFFALPSFIGTTLQMFHYGVSYNWSGMMLSVLIVYLNIQDRSLNTDYLTGVYNRRQLDRYLASKIKNSRLHAPFGAILIDLNNFKEINDAFGHTTGDDALKEAAALFQDNLRENDFIARFGGDEFVIILDSLSHEELIKTAERLNAAAEDFNRRVGKSYRLSFSLGYAIYDARTALTPDAFLQHIDSLMYEDKKTPRG
ncbi:GGDEF domain-containing protein [Azotosporobacter soli]|uniref:GGDEF domain-containing protein n=1 Tax=Azotosporobacter soli TaxID=3055040 RepID=UPI0031FE6F7A